jgi:uncharacterized protein (DUF885 family)
VLSKKDEVVNNLENAIS